MAFWDTITQEAQAEQGRKVGNDKKIGHWRIVVVGNLPFADQRLNGKIPKVIKNFKALHFFEIKGEGMETAESVLWIRIGSK